MEAEDAEAEQAEEETQTEDDVVEPEGQATARQKAQQQGPKKSFLEWFRGWNVARKTLVPQPGAADAAEHWEYQVKERNLAGTQGWQEVTPWFCHNVEPHGVYNRNAKRTIFWVVNSYEYIYIYV